MDFSLTDEQQRLVDTARKFTREKIIPVAQKLDEHGTFPKEICEQAWEIGLMNAEVPQEVGGLGLSTLDHVLAIDFTNEGEGGRDRVAVELSADSARALVDRILAALASGEAAHAAPATAVPVAAE